MFALVFTCLFWLAVAGIAYAALAAGLVWVGGRRDWHKPLHCHQPERCPYDGAHYLRYPVVETNPFWRGLRKLEPFVTAPLMLLCMVIMLKLVMPHIKLEQTQ